MILLSVLERRLFNLDFLLLHVDDLQLWSEFFSPAVDFGQVGWRVTLELTGVACPKSVLLEMAAFGQLKLTGDLFFNYLMEYLLESRIVLLGTGHGCSDPILLVSNRNSIILLICVVHNNHIIRDMRLVLLRVDLLLHVELAAFLEGNCLGHLRDRTSG